MTKSEHELKLGKKRDSWKQGWETVTALIEEHFKYCWALMLEGTESSEYLKN